MKNNRAAPEEPAWVEDFLKLVDGYQKRHGVTYEQAFKICSEKTLAALQKREIV